MPGLPQSVWVAGCGYVGRPLGALLCREGVRVLGITRSESSAQALRAQVPFQVEACDISLPAAVRELVRAAGIPGAIVHCASAGRGGADAYRTVYHDGCACLLAACPGSLLLFTSSTSVYPQTSGETVTEASPADPHLETGKILRTAEDRVLSHGGIVARLAGIYGPGRSILLQRFLGGSAIIETGPSRFLNQIHRDDIVSALALLLRRHRLPASQVYNVADGNPLTQRSCCEALAAQFQRPLPPEAPPDPDRNRGWTHKRVDCSKLRALSWEPRYPSFLDAVRLDPELVPSIERRLAGLS